GAPGSDWHEICHSSILRGHRLRRVPGRARSKRRSAHRMPSSDKTVYVAMGANLVVAFAKFVASAFTGSSSMLAEGVHSLVDTGNTGLLLLGSLPRRPQPAQTHP